LFEGMVEVPELVRGRVDLYSDPRYRSALTTYSRAITPMGTQPAVGDSPADYRLQPGLVDMANPNPDRYEGDKTQIDG